MAKKKPDAKKADAPTLFSKTAKPTAAKPASVKKASAPKAKAAKSAKPTGGGAGEESKSAKAPAVKKAPSVKKAPAEKKVSTNSGREFSTEEIGHVAGDVWHVLSNDGTKTAAELTKAVAAPPELVAAALGWLAREDKLAFETNGRSVTVSLV